MVATRQVEFRANLKKYFDIAYYKEPVIVTRKANENVAVISESDYNEYQKLKKNAKYLAKLERSYEQLQKGEVVTLSMEQLEKLAE